MQVQTVVVDSKCQELVQLLSKTRNKVSSRPGFICADSKAAMTAICGTSLLNES